MGAHARGHETAWEVEEQVYASVEAAVATSTTHCISATMSTRADRRRALCNHSICSLNPKQPHSAETTVCVEKVEEREQEVLA